MLVAPPFSLLIYSFHFAYFSLLPPLLQFDAQDINTFLNFSHLLRPKKSTATRSYILKCTEDLAPNLNTTSQLSLGPKGGAYPKPHSHCGTLEPMPASDLNYS